MRRAAFDRRKKAYLSQTKEDVRMKTMHKPLKVRVLSLSVLMFAIIACGLLILNRQAQDIALLEAAAKETQLKKIEVESLRSDLSKELNNSESNAYIAEKARSLYGYLAPGEIRFIVTNPEALYGQEPQAQIVQDAQ